MSYTKHALGRMKRDELATLAIQELGEFFDEEVTKQQMLDILVPKLVAADEEAAPAKEVSATALDPLDEKVWIMVANDNLCNRASGDQFLGVNNYEVQITFGKWFQAKRMLATMLENLIYTKHETYSDKEGRLKTRSFDMTRFSFQVRELSQGAGKDLARTGDIIPGSAH